MKGLISRYKSWTSPPSNSTGRHQAFLGAHTSRPQEGIGRVTMKIKLIGTFDIGEESIRNSLRLEFNLSSEDRIDVLMLRSGTVSIVSCDAKHLSRICRFFAENSYLQGEAFRLLFSNYRPLFPEIAVSRKRPRNDSLSPYTEQQAESILIIEAPKPRRSIIVAKYKEDISWIPSSWVSDVHLYNKDESNPVAITEVGKKWAACENLPNVGRESHSYLYHIISHYDDLADVLYFTQAHPFDHAPHIVDLIEGGIGSVAPFFPLGNRRLIIYSGDVRKYEPAFPGIQAGFDRSYPQLSNSKPIPRTIVFSPGAIFAVQKQAILRREKRYYEDALKLLDYDKNPIEGYSFERLWSVIFEEEDWI
eukprot:gene26361-31846_t